MQPLGVIPMLVSELTPGSKHVLECLLAFSAHEAFHGEMRTYGILEALRGMMLPRCNPCIWPLLENLVKADTAISGLFIHELERVTMGTDEPLAVRISCTRMHAQARFSQVRFY